MQTWQTMGKGEGGGGTLPLQRHHIVKGALAPTSLLVECFSGPRYHETPTSNTCLAERGAEGQGGGGRKLAVAKRFPFSRFSHVASAVHRMPPSSTDTCFMGSAAERLA